MWQDMLFKGRVCRGPVKQGMLLEICAHPFYPSSISVLKQEVLSSFSKKHIIKLNSNMKYKIINLKTFGVVYQVHIMQALQQDYIKQLNEDTVYHSIAKVINSLLKYVHTDMLLFCCWRNTTGLF